MHVSTKFTYDDLQSIPPDRNRYEIIEGDLFVTPAPVPFHQIILGNLYLALSQWVEPRGLGKVLFAPVDVVFSFSTVLEPDLIFISRDRLHIIGEKNVSGPPDLVVETLSESTAHVDRGVKLKQYALSGVREYWILDPEMKTAEVYRVAETGYELLARYAAGESLSSPLLPGFALPVTHLFEAVTSPPRGGE
ncbi:MAG: Uma2 family endonuclease [Terriglobia bacterium]